MANKSQRRMPQSKRYAQKANKAGDSPKIHGQHYRIKIAMIFALMRGELTPCRRECLAEWRDGHKLYNLGLVHCEHKSDSTMWLKANQKLTREYENRLILALSGDETKSSVPKTSRDKDYLYSFETKDTYGRHDDKGKYVDMCSRRSKRR